MIFHWILFKLWYNFNLYLCHIIYMKLTLFLINIMFNEYFENLLCHVYMFYYLILNYLYFTYCNVKHSCLTIWIINLIFYINCIICMQNINRILLINLYQPSCFGLYLLSDIILLEDMRVLISCHKALTNKQIITVHVLPLTFTSITSVFTASKRD